MREKQNFVILVVTRETWKRFFVVDMLFGTGTYYAFDWITSSIVFTLVGSWVLTEMMKRLSMSGGWFT